MGGLSDIVNSLRKALPGGSYRYSALPTPTARTGSGAQTSVWSDQNRRLLKASMGALVFLILTYLVITVGRLTGCEGSVKCTQSFSHLWGQYSPFFPVPSELSPHGPPGCKVTFAQVLSRHGSRDPTAGKSIMYRGLIDRVHASVTDYGKGYEFVRDYQYTLGADQLTLFGEDEMVTSGAAFYKRYRPLANSTEPFIRASGQERVINSALNWTQGFYGARLADTGAGPDIGYSGKILIIPEAKDVNNTLSHGLCPAFEDGEFSHRGDDAQVLWRDIFTRPIVERLNEKLPGANLTAQDAIMVMDLCPFNTVANREGKPSPFCRLFTLDEWKSYDYYQSLGKYYGFSQGNPMASTQGVGFVNELIARLKGQPVIDHTSTNSTLDGSTATFPLHKALYADFSHDNDMATIYAALGLYNATGPLSKTSREPPKAAMGYSASWTVSFASRMYVEKMKCRTSDSDEELVRILVNDRVVPLHSCGADSLGRCTLTAFVDSLSFARSGGLWDQCFV